MKLQIYVLCELTMFLEKKFNFLICSCFVYLACTTSAQAQDAAAIRLGETDLTPSLRIDIGQTDNAFRQGADVVENAFMRVEPELEWSADKGVTTISARYFGSYGLNDEDDLNFADHLLEGTFETSTSKRSKFEAQARFRFDHVDLGLDVFTRNNPTGVEQLEFFDQRINLQHTYGAAQARGQIISRLLIDNLDFTNNDSLTENSSRLIVQPSLRFSYRLSGDTRTFVSIRIAEIDRAANGMDRTDVDLSVGASWDITGRTGGSASIGVGQAMLDNGNDQTDLTLRAGLFYLPRSFSRFDLNLERGFFNDGSGTLTEAAIANQINLRWRYDWSARLFHVAFVEFESIERTCPDIDDQTLAGSLEFGLNVRRWLAFGLGASFETRTNGSCPASANAQVIAPDFDQQEVFLFTRISL